MALMIALYLLYGRSKNNFFHKNRFLKQVLLTVLMLLKSVATSDSGTLPLKGECHYRQWSQILAPLILP